MTCPQCQRETSPGAAFCDECGARLESRCPACGETNRPGAKFCRACGQSLLRDAVAPEPRPTPPPATVPPFEGLQSPRSYTPSHLADKILTSRSALEGERKQVTVLFADVVESTRLAGRLDAEAMHEVMDRVLRLMAQVVHRHDGTVNQFLGDGLMALVGAPLALEDHALRAAEAAFALQETIAGLSAELEKERGVQIRLRIGLNTGLVVVGRIGDDLRMDYTAVGDTTHLAARMQGLAAPGTILVAEATHRLVAGYVRSEAVGPLEVKGLTGPVLAYRLLSRRSRTRLEVRSEQGMARSSASSGRLACGSRASCTSSGLP